MRGCVVIVIVVGLFYSLMPEIACADNARPLFGGNLSIAHRLVHGNSHVMVIGDSIHNNMLDSYMTLWQPVGWSGRFVSPSFCDTFGHEDSGSRVWPWDTPGFKESFLHVSPYDNATATLGLPIYMEAISPAAYDYIEFNNTPTRPLHGDVFNRFYEAIVGNGDDQPLQFPESGDRKVDVDIALFAHPGGQTDHLFVDIRNGKQILQTIDISTYADTPQYRFYQTSLVLPEGVNHLAARFRADSVVTLTDGTSFTFIGMNVTTGVQGMEIQSISAGGRGVDHFSAMDSVSDEHLADYLAFSEVDTVYIWIGQNDLTDNWKQRVADLLDRYRAAKPGIDFVVVSSYQTGDGSKLDFMADALWELTQESDDTLFINLFDAVGGMDADLAAYLKDGVHPNDDGDNFFAQTVWNLIEASAAATVPEPGCLLLLLSTGGLICLRRKCSASAK